MASAFTEKEINEILDLLKDAYPDAGCALHHRSPYELLVCVTLSAQTTDKSVNGISPALFSAYPDAEAMAEADPKEVEKIIRKIGMYKTKSVRIIEQAKMLVDKYGGKVPEDDELLAGLPGVGRKTANVVMSVAFGHQRIAVDTHVFRVSNRIGLASAKNVEKTEEQLKKALPERRWTEAHHSLIFHGRQCCSARRPDCENCAIAHLCRKKGVEI
jgi:endonuclease-3